jgi:hygromycin-B 4-O-kinase
VALPNGSSRSVDDAVGSRPATQAGAVQRLLETRTGSSVTDLERIPHGEWSTAYRFRQGGRTLVVRFSRYREDLDKDRFAARWSSDALPIPSILELAEAPEGWLAISEWVAGAYLESLDEQAMHMVSPAFLSAMDAVRAINPPSTGYGLWEADEAGRSPTWRAWLLDVAKDDPDRRAYGWRARLAKSPVGLDLFADALERMRSLLAHCPEDRHVVHTDLLHMNVLVDGRRIAAVLDWAGSTYGDFLYDIATLTFWSPWYSAWSRIDFESQAARHYAEIGLSVPRYQERLRCYELHIALSHLAYCAYRGRLDDLAWVARRTREVIAACRSA